MSVSFHETAADVIFRKLVVAESHRRVVEAVLNGETDWQAASRGIQYLKEKFTHLRNSPDLAGDILATLVRLAEKARTERPVPVNAGAPL